MAPDIGTLSDVVGSSPRHSILKRLLVITGLSAIAFTGPLLDLYGRNPEVFVANRTDGAQIFLFGLGVALLIPLLSWGLLSLAELTGGSAPDVVYGVIVGVLAIAAGLVVSRQASPESTFAAVVIALGVAALAMLVVWKLDVVFVVAAVAIPVLMIMFLATSATARLIWSEPEPVEGATTIAAPYNVVMLQLDEFPLASIMDTDGTINEDLFPGFARLAEEGTWYRNAFSTSIATTQSVPAILTGLVGESDASPSYTDHPDNLFTLLGDTYDMHVIEWVAEMCPEETCPDYAGRAPARFSNLIKDVGVVYGHLTLPAALRESLPSIDNTWKGFLGQGDGEAGAAVAIDGLPVPPQPARSDWVDWVQRLINGIDSEGPPTLSYAHLQAPHVPWQLNPSGTQYERPEEYTEVEGVGGDGRWGTEPAPALLGFQRHLYQVGFLDQMISRLLDHLVETGTWDDTMVIVVADHGASFVPGEHRRWPFADNRDDLYRIPMFVKYPGQATGEIVDEPVFGTDLLPTVVEVLGADVDWAFDGSSLLDIPPNRPHEPLRWCCNSTGVSTDLSILFDQVERNHRWIPDQTSWDGIAAVGPFGDLVGEPAGALLVSGTHAFSWSLDLGADLDEVDRGSGIVQTLITGRLQAASSPPAEDLIIVLNDVVAGVAHLSRDSATGGSLSGLVAEDLVRDGHNDIQLLLSDGRGGWLTGQSGEISLELVAGDGHVLDLGTEGARRVQVDTVAPTDDGWELVGWAADVSSKLTPDTIYVFAGEELLYEGPPNVENRNVVRWFESEDLLESGFDVEISGEDVPEGIDQVLVVAEFGDTAVGDAVALTE